MNISVTGGAGFIGSHITDALIAAGHAVTVVDNLSSGKREHVHEQASFFPYDIRDREKMADVFRNGRFEVVFHEAAQTLVPYSLSHPQADADLNIMALLVVLDCCRTYGVRRIVFSSSAAVYGDNMAVPLKETEVPAPTSFYGLTKATAESYLQLYEKHFGLSYVILRYANVYGERQGSNGEGGVVYVFAKALAQGKDLTIYGDGEQSRDFVYVKDVAQANVKALEKEVPSGIYNVSTAIETTVNALKEILIYFSGKGVSVSYADGRSGDIYRSSLSNDKASEVLHWRPATKLLPGLTATYAYFAEEE